MQPTHIAGPTFDPPGRSYGFGWGTSSIKTTGPAVPIDEPVARAREVLEASPVSDRIRWLTRGVAEQM